MIGARPARADARLVRCLAPDEAQGRRAAFAFRRWLAPRVAGWRAAGLAPPDRRRLAPPAPGGGEPIHLVGAADPSGLVKAGAWLATASFSGDHRAAARRLLTDCLGIGAAVPLPAFTTGREAAAVLDAFDVPELPRVPLWRAVDGRRRAGLFGAILWNRLSGDPRELHVGPECVAAAVAAAECLDRPLGELLDAIAAASGIAAWHRDLVGRAMERRGIHPPGALAAVASAAAVARLVRLTPTAATHALRTADFLTPLHPYSAFREGAGLKLVYGAFGQFLGTAAVLGPMFPGRGAVFPPARPSGPLRCDGAGRRADIRFDPEAAARAIHAVTFKKYPGSRALQPALAALASLGPVEPGRIDRIEVVTYPYAAALSAVAAPEQGPIAAQMHLPTAVALFLRARHVGRRFRAADYGSARHPETVALAARVRVRPKRFGAAGGPLGNRLRRARVRVLLREGPARSAAAGNAWAPPPPGAITRRFHRLAAGAGLRDPASLAGAAPVRRLFAGSDPEAESRQP